MVTKPSISLEEMEKTVHEAAENGVVLNEKIPTIELAELLVQEGEPDFLAELGRVLVEEFYRRAIHSIRRKPRITFGMQFSLPQFEHLPQNVRIDKKRRSLAEMVYRDVRAAYRKESVRLNDQKRNNPRLAEWKALLAEMEKKARKDPGITVGRALGLK